MGKPIRALIVEDSKTDTELLLLELRKGGYEPTHERVETAQAMSRALDSQTWDVVISDYIMPHFNGLAALELLKASGIDLPFIIVSGSIGEDIAVEAMKAGAHDYFLKGNLARLVPAVERELREAVDRRVRRQAEEQRDSLMRQLLEVNEQLTLTSLRLQDQADQNQRLAAEVNGIVESIAEAVIVYDPQGDIVRINSVAADLLGGELDESGQLAGEPVGLAGGRTLKGQSLLPIVTPVSRAMRGETVRGVVLFLRGPGSKTVRALVTAAPIRDPKGRFLGVVATIADISILRDLQTA